MQSSNIIIVSNKKDSAKKVISKIVLLRSQDTVSVISYKGITDFISENDVDLILLYIESAEDIEVIQKIKSIRNNVYVLVVSEIEDSELLCGAFDSGADDYAVINVPETLFLMRVMWALKRKSQVNNSNKKSEILADLKIFDNKTNFYRKEYTNKFFDKEYKTIAEKGITDSYLLMLSVDRNHRSRFSSLELAEYLKNVMRISDIAGFSSDDIIYLILNKTSKNGVKSFYERLSKFIEIKGNISASAINITDKIYADSLSVLNNLLNYSLKKGKTLMFNDDNNNEDSVLPSFQILDTEKKNFLRKIEKVINPAFFKMSAIYEPKFFDTKVLHSVGKYQSTFTLKSNLCYAQVKLSYGETEKINLEIDCIFYGKEKVEVCEISHDELTGELLENIIQSVAMRYKKALDNKE